MKRDAEGRYINQGGQRWACRSRYLGIIGSLWLHAFFTFDPTVHCVTSTRLLYIMQLESGAGGSIVVALIMRGIISVTLCSSKPFHDIAGTRSASIASPAYGFVYVNCYAIAKYLLKTLILLSPSSPSRRPHQVAEYSFVGNLFNSSSNPSKSEVSRFPLRRDSVGGSASGARPSCIGINIDVLGFPYSVVLRGLYIFCIDHREGICMGELGYFCTSGLGSDRWAGNLLLVGEQVYSWRGLAHRLPRQLSWVGSKKREHASIIVPLLTPESMISRTNH